LTNLAKLTLADAGRAAFLFLLATFVGSEHAHAAVKGTFVGPGTYATEEGCKKRAAIQASGDKNAGTVPETLTEDGFMSWEGGCSFTSFTEKDKGRMWTANLKCFESADESKESDVFERLDDRRIKMTVMGNATLLQRCDAEKGK
jgi:hypothetical protein